jgi:hypothetical protein
VWIYGGAEYNANAAFQSGEITFLMQSTSSLDGILETVGDSFEVRTTFLPRLANPKYAGATPSSAATACTFPTG